MNYLQRSKNSIANTYVNRGVTITRGDEVYLYDDTGKQYLDFTSGVGVSILGHNSEVINSAIAQQASKLITLHSSFVNDQRVLMAENLLSYLPQSLSKVYLSSSGTEAIEAALKFSIYTTGKHKFIHAKSSFHGKTLGSLRVMGNDHYREPFKDVLDEDLSVPFGDLESLKILIAKHKSDLAGVILEPIQGESGIVVAENGYLEGVQEICNQNDIILIFDEIQSGMGRTGKFLASQQSKAVPDIVCLGKGLAGGLPISATVITDAINDKLKSGVHTSTFGGNPLCCAVSNAVLNFIKDTELLKQNASTGEYFINNLKQINNSIIKTVRGKGLMIGLELNVNVTEVLKKMQNSGLLAFPSGSNIIRFLPPYIVTTEQIDEALDITIKALN